MRWLNAPRASRCAGPLRRLNGPLHLHIVVNDHLRRRDRGNRSTRSRAIRPRRAPPPCFRGSLSGSCTKCFPGTVFRYPLRAVAAWPGEWVLPSAASPGSAHGIFFTPFAGLLPPEADAHLCASGPTCPFARDRPARFIFVGMIRSRLHLARAIRGRNHDLDFWD